jgi:hypothetical protein
MNGAVFWGAILSVLAAVLALGFLVYEVLRPMRQDAEGHGG